MERNVKLEYLKQFQSYLNNPNQESLDLSLNNVHSKGLFSLVLNGTEFGKLKRVFVADKKLKPYSVQLHTHRYPIILTVLKGEVKQYEAKRCEIGVAMTGYKYKSFLNGGNGLEFLNVKNYTITEFTIPIGGSILMSTDEFHTVSCSKGSIWIVEEMGFDKDSSLVLGVPFTPENLYTKPEMFQVNDKCQLVKKQIDKLVNSYTF